MAASQSKPVGPWQLFWKHFRKSPLALAGGVILIMFYGSALLAPFLSPYTFDEQDRESSWRPPTKIHFKSQDGSFSRPFIYHSEMVDPLRRQYAEVKTQEYPIQFFVKGPEYKLLGMIPSDRHLFGVDEPGRMYLFGTDQLGRDVFTRLLYGSRISLSVGLFGILITYSLGMLFGGIAGYFGGLTDNILMRISEVMMSVPALYLILALRAAFPADLRSDLMYMLIILILSLVLWASLARIIRGMVLSIRENEYVTAAEALGVSPLKIIVKHILPNTLSFVIVAATISIPGYILGEVALSFLGAGIQEPIPSWGNMLQQAQSVNVLTSYKWVLAPGVAIFFTVLAFNFLGDGLRDALDPKRIQGDA